MDFMAGVALGKQILELLNVIKEGRDDALVKEAAGNLSAKITELQMLNVELSGLYQEASNAQVKLRDENNKIKMFIMQAENYELYTTEGGSTVYRSKESADGVITPHYLCAHCFGEHQKSILQPSVETIKSMNFFVHRCPRCKNEYRMNKVPPITDVHIPKSIKSFN
ncbi:MULTISPECIES: hypothetical protein [Hafnia]|uniref:hypothetical protein n=1 Tax=Hafnia TaxID=568 RepID=UPI00103FBA3E|nr:MULTISPECIES: hypothetical protein [Hafnia]MBW2958943.1 hypothetical protein [Hafnia paralvei]QBJ32897.1 hypothetical protein EYZ02_08330 [Hafnia alvei]